MKKAIALLLAVIMLLSFAGCSKGESSENTETTQHTEQRNDEETVNNALSGSGSYDALETKFQAEIESGINALVAEWEIFIVGITNYEQYVANASNVEAFYQKILSTSESLCVKLCACSIEYAEAILASGRSADEMYEDIDNIYDAIYEDLADDVYDGIYDGLLKDEVYDELYNGALKKRPDGVEYSDWSDVRSNEYELWSDTRSDAYEHWSDARSDVYGFCSDLRSELYGDDLEGALDEIEDFRKDVAKMGGTVSTSTPTTTTPTNNTSSEIDADFKAAMDSYEKFFDEYVAIIKKYKANPTDLSILTDYATYMSQYADMIQKLEEWESKDLNTAEAAYYVDVQARIAKKLLEVA